MRLTRRIGRLFGDALANAYVRITLVMLGVMTFGLVSSWASRFFFTPGWPLAGYSDNLWVQLTLPIIFSLLCWYGFRWALQYLSQWRWSFTERAKDFDFPSWIELRRLGESNAVKLTALAPVLGSLVLMNDEVDALLRSTLLDYSLDHSRKPMLGFVYVPRLHMIYLGLSLLGVGAIAFGLFCPDLIKRYASAADWLEREDRFLTGGRLRGEFNSIVTTYWANTRSIPTSPPEPEDENPRHWVRFGESEDRERIIGYSADRYFQIHALINEIVDKEDPSLDEWEPPKAEPSTILAPDGLPAFREEEPIVDAEAVIDESLRRFRNGPREYVNTDAWLYVLAHAAHYERQLWDSLTHTASEFFKERIIDIRFDDLAHEHRLARAVIVGVYALGITALAIPTLHTFGAIVESAFR